MEKINILIVVFAFVILRTTTVTSHGAMLLPINWFDFPEYLKTDKGWVFGYAGMKSHQLCSAGATTPEKIICPNPGGCDGYQNPGASCTWFNNWTFVEKPTLFDPKLRTYPHNKYPQYVLHHPWRAPGVALIDSPCGVAGGNPRGCGGPKCGQVQGGFAYGPKAENVDFIHDLFVTNWTRGDEVEVAWGIRANHGGGYSYRLCKMPEVGRKGLTEECFQQKPLEFVGDTQWVQYGEDKSTRIAFPAVRTDQGTNPPGSQWTKNPIPVCNGISGGIYGKSISNCSNGTQFPAPGPGLNGYGFLINDDTKTFSFSIIDLVKIPKDLEPGNYVISFRWDCEQTPQVWNTCANVRLN